jgi:hypothetical protein
MRVMVALYCASYAPHLTLGGHQDAPDEGLDVRLALAANDSARTFVRIRTHSPVDRRKSA